MDEWPAYPARRFVHFCCARNNSASRSVRSKTKCVLPPVKNVNIFMAITSVVEARRSAACCKLQARRGRQIFARPVRCRQFCRPMPVSFCNCRVPSRARWTCFSSAGCRLKPIAKKRIAMSPNHKLAAGNAIRCHRSLK